MGAVQTAFDFFSRARASASPDRARASASPVTRAHASALPVADRTGANALPDAEAEVARGVRKLELRLSELLGAVVDLTLTDNSRTMVSARERQGITHVRLHNMFVGADETTL